MDADLQTVVAALAGLGDTALRALIAAIYGVRQIELRSVLVGVVEHGPMIARQYRIRPRRTRYVARSSWLGNPLSRIRRADSSCARVL